MSGENSPGGISTFDLAAQGRMQVRQTLSHHI